MKKIDKIFDKSKSISLDLYLEKVLYDRNVGYYSKNNPFGIKGDYITAPNISKIFSEMIFLWLISYWKKFHTNKKINVVELGAGRRVLRHAIGVRVAVVLAPLATAARSVALLVDRRR